MLAQLQLSRLSQDEMDGLWHRRSIPFEEALRYMTEELRVRTFSETLSAIYEKDDLKQRLVEEMYSIAVFSEEAISKDSVARNVRNWLGGIAAPDRKHLIQLCFALGLDEKKADTFLNFTSDGGFHMRNQWELVLAYGLRTGKRYDECVRFYESLPKPNKPDQSQERIVFTRTVSDLFREITDDKAFVKCYEENCGALGEMRNTAYYRCFLPFINTLLCPDVPEFFEGERRYSVEEVVSSYLRMDIPLEANTAKYTLLQRTVRRYWPNASSITRMRNRTEDVSRKVILLLYLVTGGHSAQPGGTTVWDEDIPDEEQFENHYWKLNSMMDDCGFSLLDPRRVFDWLVLFCLRADGDELMSDRLQEMMRIIFRLENT